MKRETNRIKSMLLRLDAAIWTLGILLMCGGIEFSNAQEPSGAVAKSLAKPSAIVASRSSLESNKRPTSTPLGARKSKKSPPSASVPSDASKESANGDGRSYLNLNDGTIVAVDEAWEDEQGVWYRRDGVTHLLSRERVKAVKHATNSKKTEAASESSVARVVDLNATQNPVVHQPIWIHLIGGARVEVDEVTETLNGAWYRRGTLSIFLDRARIERIEREPAVQAASNSENARAWKERGWTTGNAKIDTLIRQSGSRYGVDPYLIFCVMEQESHFHPRAVSPVGASGLMQLMPDTAARFGVTRVFDPAQNIMGGTRYLKWLLQEFNGRVDLVLAGYNAGEGAVMKYGHKVPPYTETRNYVKRISARYKQNKVPVTTEKAETAVAGASRLR